MENHGNFYGKFMEISWRISAIESFMGQLKCLVKA